MFTETWRTIPYTDISAMLQPSGEIPLHFNLQKKISDNNVRVVTHLHPTYTVAAMHAGIELSELVNSFPELRRYTSVARNVGEVPPISEELGRACCDSLGLDSVGNLKYNIVGIKGHGVVSVGSSPWEAFEHIERLEHIAKIVLVSGNY
jgi:L-fuculose-phosphate aldolase